MMAGPSGTFLGHLLPGLVFMAWGLWWLWEETTASTPRTAADPLERSLGPTIVKIAAFLIALPLEMPNAGWEPMDWVMGWHHITGYMAFFLAGLVDLAARRGWVSARATYVALAGAAFNGALLFYGHGNAPGVEGAAHTILMGLFTALALFAILETAAPTWRLSWFRIGALIAVGGWLVMTAWMLWMSGWDLADHAREGHVWLRVSWMVMAIATLTTLGSIRARMQEA